MKSIIDSLPIQLRGREKRKCIPNDTAIHGKGTARAGERTGLALLPASSTHCKSNWDPAPQLQISSKEMVKATCKDQARQPENALHHTEIRNSIKKMMLTVCTNKVQAIGSFLPKKVRSEGKRGDQLHTTGSLCNWRGDHVCRKLTRTKVSRQMWPTDDLQLLRRERDVITAKLYHHSLNLIK